MKKTILILIAIAAIAAGCTKFEEGPYVFSRSVNNRIHGSYTLSRYTVDGVDSLQQMKNRFGLNFEFYYNEHNDNEVLRIDGGTNPSRYFISRYGYHNNTKSIYIVSGALILGYLSPDEDIDMTILKLKDADIHLKTSYNNKEYYLELN